MGRKVCHVTSAHGRYDIRIFVKQCKSLAKNGYDVTLIVNDEKDDEVIDGVKIVSTRYKPKNRIERFLNSKKRTMDKAIEVNADIYQLHDPDLLPIGNELKRMGKKVIFDSHEDVPKQIRDKGWIPSIIRNTISKTYEVYEKTSIKRYDAVISVTPQVVERLKKINSNTVMVTNYPIVNKNEKIERNPEKAICFAGGITSQWNHINIIKSIEQIEDMRYILAGSGSAEYLSKLNSLEGWKRVDYLGRIPFEEVKDKVYSKSLVGMTLLSSNTQVGDEGTLGNTKIFEFMEAGLPIICSNNRLWNQIVDEYECGIAVNPNNVNEIINAITYLIDTPEKALLMGESGRRAIKEKFNWYIEEKKLLELYEEL